MTCKIFSKKIVKESRVNCIVLPFIVDCYDGEYVKNKFELLIFTLLLLLLLLRGTFMPTITVL